MNVVITEVERDFARCLGLDIKEHAHKSSQICTQVAVGEIKSKVTLARKIQEEMTDADILKLAVDGVLSRVQKVMGKVNANPLEELMKALNR